ncbi:MAG: cytochrome c [Gammaproteobacteria bacterium]
MQTSVQGADINNGKQLHAENCMRCHQPEIYTSNNRKVSTFIQLRKKVEQCELINELAWFEEEVDDVTAYLNATYYLFGVK